MYPPELVKPMIEELTAVGFEELKTAEAVKEALKRAGTTLVVVNSVCGCAARNARPAVIYSLQNAKKPDHLTTVFAGVDREATEEARNFMLPFPPSSPSMNFVTQFLFPKNPFVIPKISQKDFLILIRNMLCPFNNKVG